MEVELAVQAQSLVLAFGLGALLGLSYDCLRPLRRRAAAFGAAVLDAAFSLAALAGAFTLAMSAQPGRLGIWELAMTLIGFIMYMHTVSDRVYALFDGALGAVEGLAAHAKKIIKKTAKLAKILFHKVRECFIIKDD